jgi:hypothetical protein
VFHSFIVLYLIISLASRPLQSPGAATSRMKHARRPGTSFQPANNFGVASDLKKAVRFPTDNSMYFSKLCRYSANILLVPVWDCSKHFLYSEGVEEDEFSVQEILTQSLNNDPRWTEEIPVDSWVAVHTLPNAYSTSKMSRAIGLNIVGVQILVKPKVY